MNEAEIADLVRRLDALQANESRLIAEAHDNKQRARAFEKDAKRYRKLRAGNYSIALARSILNNTPLGIDEAVDALPAVGAA